MCVCVCVCVCVWTVPSYVPCSIIRSLQRRTACCRRAASSRGRTVLFMLFVFAPHGPKKTPDIKAQHYICVEGSGLTLGLTRSRVNPASYICIFIS